MEAPYQNDHDLVEALRRGGKVALQHIYRKCYPVFEAYVAKSGGTVADAQDCFQNGILSVWVNVRTGRYQLRENAAFSTYVLGVCKYVWMNHIRSAYHKTTDLDRDLPDLVQAEPDLDYEQKLKMLNTGLSHLGKNCQEVLRLFYFERLSYEEIAVRTGRAADSLKNQKYRCISRLREWVNNREKPEQ